MGRRSASARAGSRALLFAAVLALLAAPLTSVSSAADGDDLTLAVTLSEATEDGDWYSDSQPLEISVALRNDGDSSVALEYNPSCPAQMTVLTGEPLTEFVTLDDLRTCLEQQRAIDLLAHQTRQLDSFSWDWSDGQGEVISSGPVTLRFEFDNASMQEFVLQFQRQPVSGTGLTLVISAALPPGGGRTTFQPGDTLWAHAGLSNSGEQSVTMPMDVGCRMQVSTSSATSEHPSRLTDIGCGSGSTLAPGESTSLGWWSWDFTEQGSEIAYGEWTLDFSLTGLADSTTSHQFRFKAGGNVSSGTPLALTLTTNGVQDGDGVLRVGDLLTISADIENTGQAITEVEFNNSCWALMHVISSDGLIVLDDRLPLDCEMEHFEKKLDPSETLNVMLRDWDMTDNAGCELDNGEHLLVVDVLEYGLAGSWAFEYAGDGSGAACRAANQDLSTVWFTVEELTVLNAGTLQEEVQFELRLLSSEPLDIFWPQACRLDLTMHRSGDVLPHRVWSEACDDPGGALQTIDGENALHWGPFTVDFVDAAGDPLRDGTWMVTAKTTGTPSLSTQLAHTWSTPEVIEETDSTSTSESTEGEGGGIASPVDDADSGTIIEGDWNYVTTDTGGCWLLVDLEGNEHPLVGDDTGVEWQPQPQLQGAYWVHASEQVSTACAPWAPGIVVDEVLGERIVEPEAAAADDEVAGESEAGGFAVNAPALISVVASTGFIGLAMLTIAKVEWIRMPASRWGLVLLGLVKKRDNGGEYQRGRIVTYVELHSGIHFRALLSSLSMSNGQLAHHLNVLETDERVWKRRDGRKVRYYSAMVARDTPQEELPVPVLQPDPNSLQGKILEMLDIHENEILNLSQKELAVKLDTSQQLVSYHLKSLEQWGLIEKEKVALRYRYRLTDRAVLLINNHDLSVPDE